MDGRALKSSILEFLATTQGSPWPLSASATVVGEDERLVAAVVDLLEEQGVVGRTGTARELVTLTPLASAEPARTMANAAPGTVAPQRPGWFRWSQARHATISRNSWSN
jgi:hypothetical protein